MAEKKDDEDPNFYINSGDTGCPDKIDVAENSSDEASLERGVRNHRNLNLMFEADQGASYYDMQFRKDENPFSFKKFLNQDSSRGCNRGARRKVYEHSTVEDCDAIPARLVNTPEMSSVLPDFVQDHLVVEQCYLSSLSSSHPPTLDMEALSLHNLPDLNIEHREHSNLPDFTLSAGHFNMDSASSASKRLPDFALHTSDQRTLDSESEWTSSSSLVNGQRGHMSSSPSAPTGLPSYSVGSGISASNGGDIGLPFDLPLAAEGDSSRTMPSSDSVSKSLPDFLSDGPIRKERLDECSIGSRNSSYLVTSMDNGMNGLSTADSPSPRSEIDRLQREVDSLRRHLLERNRRVEVLETELSLLHARDQRETNSMEHALQQVETHLKQTTKRAVAAEAMVSKLKQENKSLKTQVSCLRTENSELLMGSVAGVSLEQPQQARNHRIAVELRSAASAAESSLRSLLTGIDNLRVIAASVENMHKFQDRTDEFQNRTDEFQDFNYEDSASGPAL